MSFILNLLLFVVVLTIIVAIHEFGHFIFAKITGVYVYEFAIGMGPKIVSKKFGETVYSIRAIPFGGFCQLAGEDLEEDKSNKVPKDKQLQNKKWWQRFLIMFFGPMNNFILAVILLFIVAIGFGGTTMNPVLTGIQKDSAAYNAGLKKGDVVVSINKHKISTTDDLSLYLAIADPKKNSSFVVERDGKKLDFLVKPKKVVTKVDGKKQTSYVYGISLKQKRTHSIGNAFVYTYKKTCSIFKQMYITLSSLFTGGVKVSQLSGPVGIYSVVGEQAKGGFYNILYLMAFLSINVGVINLLPIPAFDGGHILFIIIELIKGSPVNPELENKIHTIFLLLLLALMLFVTFNDILRLF